MASFGSIAVIVCLAVLFKDITCNPLGCGCDCGCGCGPTASITPSLCVNVPNNCGCGQPVITELVPALQYGDVSLAGDLPIGGTIKVKGCFPVYGLIAVEGNVPSSGTAVVNTACGNPGCDCGCSCY